MTRILGLLVLAAALAPVSAPRVARAQWPSTTTVECLSPSGLACTGLRFFIDAAGSNRLTSLSIFNKNPAYFNFASVLSFTDANGQAIGWLSVVIDLARSSLEFATGGGTPTLEPLYVTVGLATGSTGTAAQAYDGSFTYAASGYEGTSGDTPLTTIGAVTGPTAATSVTPEPATLLLFGTGLAGLAGVARRRRSNASRGGEA